MSETKNYSNCPLKKRPIMIVNEEEAVSEPEQDQPVDLRMKKVKCEEQIVFSVKEEFPLKDITLAHQQRHESIYNHIEPERPARIGRDIPNPLYNLLPGYQYAQQNIPSSYSTHHDIPTIKQELFSPYSREYSISPPAPEMFTPSNGKVPACYEDKYSTKINYSINSSRYLPYAANKHHLIEDYHQIPIVASPNSLTSIGSPRSSLSPASTGSLSEDMYHLVSKQTSPLFDVPEHPFQYCEEKSETVQRYQCNECGKSYSTYSGLTKHKNLHCPATEGNQAKKSFSCKYCEKVYTSLGALKMHIRTHTLPCKCQICGKAFSRPWLLQGHIRTHTGEKPFSCQYCHRAFADRSNLRAHLQTHSDVKKYSCGSCSKTFSRMSLLTKHREGGCAGDLHPPISPTYHSV